MNKFIMTLSILCVALNGEALKAVCDRDDINNVVICKEKKLGRLMWQDGADIFEGNWDEAKRYCENLNFAGHSDWRLPTRLELLSITDDSRYNPAINKAFKHVAYNKNDKGEIYYDSYWSSTRRADDSSLAWVVHFRDGIVGWSFRFFRDFVRCARQD